MRQLWRVFSFFAALHRQEYTGRVEISWKDGVPQHTRAEANRTPDELPGADDELVTLLREAQKEQQS